MRLRRTVACAVVLAALAPSAACAPSEEPAAITVLAVPSLAGPLSVLAARFERAHPGVEVAIRFGSGPDLAREVEDGADVDVLAVASPQSLDGLPPDLVTDPRFYATNRAVLVSRRDAESAVRVPADLRRRGARVAVCPAGGHDACGGLATDVLRAVGVPLRSVTPAADEQEVVELVRSGQVDAGIVFETAAQGLDAEVVARRVPPRFAAGTSFGVTRVRDSDHPRLAQGLVDLLVSAPTRRLLRDAGFGPPQR